jgi:hypothetical protein
MNLAKIIAAAVLSIALALPVVATAQTDTGSGVAASSTTLTTTTLPITGLGATIYGIYTSVRGNQPPPPPAAAPAAAAYLRENHTQLAQDITFGSGPALKDLAAAAEIAPQHLAAFGKMIRRHRAELLDLAAMDKLTPERALKFMGLIGESIKADKVLSADFGAFMKRHGLDG